MKVIPAIISLIAILAVSLLVNVLPASGSTQPPPAPTLVFPADGAQVTTTSIVFEWGSNPDTTKYWLEINTDPNWDTETRLYYSYPSPISATSQIVAGFPCDGTTYYWRVYAGNAYGWSAPSDRTLISVSLPLPAAPNLIFPDESAVVGGKSIQFEWEAPIGATRYWLEVNSDPSWGSGTRLYYGYAPETTHMVTGFLNPPLTGIPYWWRVWAGNSRGWGDPSSRSFTNLGPPTPDSPTLTFPDNGTIVTGPSITFQWQTSTTAYKYWLEVNTDSTWGPATRFYYGYGDATTNSKTVTGFPNDGTTYHWRVWAANEQGWSDPSSGRSFDMFSPPIAPSLIYPEQSATDVPFQSINLSWTAAQLATKYWLEVNSDPTWKSETRFYYGYGDASTASKILTNFSPSTTYYWRVWAGNSAGWSPASAGQIFTTSALTTPKPPIHYLPTNGADVAGTSITFQWTSSGGATKYWLEINRDPNWGSATRFYYGYGDAAIHSKMITGFPNNGTLYYWRLWAGNATGWSAATSGWSVYNGILSSIPPESPVLFSPIDGEYIDTTSIAFQWSAPSGATIYWLEINRDPNWGTGTRFYDGDALSNSKTIGGFPNIGTTYYWRVRAGNSYGWSAPADNYFINSIPPPSAPTLVSPILGALTGGTFIKFTWQISTGATMYWLEVNSDPNWGSDTRLFYALADGTSQLVGGFPNPSDNGITFYWRVMAGNDKGWSNPSSSYFINIGPPPPNAPVLLSPANGAAVVGSSITFQWQASTGATYYWLEVNPDPNWSSTTRKFYNSVSTTSQVVSGFAQDGITYFWRVWAGNAQDLGNPSGRSFVMTPIPIAPTPIYPNQGATIIQPESIIFTWTATEWATKYLLEINSDPSWGSATRLFYGEVSGTSKTVTGFALDTTYYWRVSAGNTIGWSPPSASQSFTVATIQVPETPTLSSPTNGANVAGTSITFEWNAVAWASKYWLEVNKDAAWGEGTRLYYADTSSNSRTVSGFPNNGTTYYWRVWAGNTKGWSTPTSGWSLVNGFFVPSAPTLLSPENGALVSGTSLTYHWDTSPGAEKYWLLVSTNSDIYQTSAYKFSDDLGNITQYVDSGYPNNGTTYHWWVWAGNNAGWCSTSQVLTNGRNFINASLIPTPTYTATPASTVTPFVTPTLPPPLLPTPTPTPVGPPPSGTPTPTPTPTPVGPPPSDTPTPTPTPTPVGPPPSGTPTPTPTPTPVGPPPSDTPTPTPTPTPVGPPPSYTPTPIPTPTPVGPPPSDTPTPIPTPTPTSAPAPGGGGGTGYIPTPTLTPATTLTPIPLPFTPAPTLIPFTVSILVTASTNSIEIGETLQLSAFATYSDDSIADVTGNVNWSSSEDTIAVVSPLGLVTGVGQGTAQIAATLEGIKGTFEVTVTQAPIIISTATPTPTPQTRVTTVPWVIIACIVALVLAAALAGFLLWRRFFWKRPNIEQ